MIQVINKGEDRFFLYWKNKEKKLVKKDQVIEIEDKKLNYFKILRFELFTNKENIEDNTNNNIITDETQADLIKNDIVWDILTWLAIDFMQKNNITDEDTIIDSEDIVIEKEPVKIEKTIQKKAIKKNKNINK